MPIKGQGSSYGGRTTKLVGADGGVASVDASGALRTTEYDSTGEALVRVPTATFMAPIWVKQTAATASGQVVWQLTAGLADIRIRRIWLQLSFQGTAAATTVLYHICKATAVEDTLPTGGTSFTPIDISAAESSLANGQYLDTGLTTTGFTYGTAIAVAALPISVTSHTAILDVSFGDINDENGGIYLPANQTGDIVTALAIRIGGLAAQATVVGTTLSGYVKYTEVL